MNDTNNNTQADIQTELDRLNPEGHKAYDNHVLAVPNKPLEVTKGGIVVPESARRSDAWYTIVSLGYGVERLNLLDRIIFKDASAIMGGKQIVTNESAVYITRADGPNPIVAIPKGQIISVGASKK